MGIKGLMKLITDNAPRAVKEKEIKNYFGQKVAVDASMSLYQFLVAVRTGGDDAQLTNENGEVTSHLQGMFYRTIRMMDNGLKPAFVFDGKPPELKGGELDKRRERREKTEEELKTATEEGNQEDMNKYSRRLVHVTKEHNDEVKRLLRLMGVPVVEAPSEAEAQCAALCAADKVYATATEDMDCLTFGTKRQLRHLSSAASRKLPIVEIDLAIVLEDLKMTMDQFIDMCVLCGCDYTCTIRGIGPGRSFDMLTKNKCTEDALVALDSKKYPVPEDFLYKEAAKLFKDPEITNPEEVKLEWTTPDEEGIIQFMCNEKGFALDRIQAGIKRLKAAKNKGSQKRLENFFGAVTTTRKAVPSKKDAKGKKGSKAKGKGPVKKKQKR